MTTTVRATSTAILDVDNVLYTDAYKFDRDAFRADYRDEIQSILPAGITLTDTGEVYAEVTEGEHIGLDELGDSPKCECLACVARSIDWEKIEARLSFWDIAQRHELPSDVIDRLNRTIARAGELSAAIADRDNAIRDARKAGMSATDLAERAGLAVSRIYQILSN